MWFNNSFLFWISFNCLSVLKSQEIISNQQTNDYKCNNNGFYVVNRKIAFLYFFLKVINMWIIGYNTKFVNLN
jgi:hypothetical protein